MRGVYHWIGSDLSQTATGDLQLAEGVVLGQQRILRRLLTSPKSYMWHPNYGAGLGQYVGSTINTQQVTATIRGQMAFESAVAKTPEPVITVTPIPNGMSVMIQYTDSGTQTRQVLSFNVNQ